MTEEEPLQLVAGQICTLSEEQVQSLKCPICKDVYNIPKIVKCSHIFCKACLDQYIYIKDCNFPPCPVCRQRISYVPNKGADSFPTFTFFQDIIQEIRALSTKVPCDACKKLADIKTVCLTCDKRLCQNCATAHSAFPSTAEHFVLSAEEYNSAKVTEILSRRKVACDDHKQYILDLYCSGCNCFACVQCGLTKHSGHIMTDLKHQANICRERLDRIDENLNLYICDENRKMQDVDRAMEKFKESSEKTEQCIVKHFESKMKLLEAQRNKVMKELKCKEKEINAHFVAEKDIIARRRTEAKSIRDFIYAVNQYSSDLELVKQSDVIENRWKENDVEYQGLESFEIEFSYEPYENTDLKEDACIENLTVKQTVPVISAFTASKSSVSGDIISLTASSNRMAIVSEFSSFYGKEREMEVYDFNGKLLQRKPKFNSSDDSALFTVLRNESNESPSNIFMVDYHEGRTKATIMSDTGLILHQFFMKSIPSCIAANPNGGIFLYNSWQGIRSYNLGGCLLSKIGSVSGKPILKHMAANSLGEIAVTGESQNGDIFVKILNCEGEVDNEHKIDKFACPWTPSVEPKAIAIDNSSNVLLCLQCSRRETRSKFIFKTEKIISERHLYLISKDGQRRENLTLPKLDQGCLIDVQNMAIKNDGQLLLAIKSNSSTNIMTVRYLT